MVHKWRFLKKLGQFFDVLNGSVLLQTLTMKDVEANKNTNNKGEKVRDSKRKRYLYQRYLMNFWATDVHNIIVERPYSTNEALSATFFRCFEIKSALFCSLVSYLSKNTP